MGLGRLNPFRKSSPLNPGNLVDTARNITGGTAGAIENVAQTLGNTVESIVSDPKKLAAVGIMVAFPGAAGAVGDFILGDALAVDAAVASGAMSASEAALAGTTALGSGSAASAIVGQAAINAATNGGDVEQAVKAALVQQGLPAALKSDVMQSLNKDMVDVLGKYGAQATTQAGLAAIMGKDPVAAFVFSGASSAVNLITKEIPGWNDLPGAVQKSVNSALLANLTGKDAATAAANSLVGSAINAGKDYVTIQSKLAPTGRMLTAEQLVDIPMQHTSYVAMANPQSVENISKYLDMADKGDLTFRGGDLIGLGNNPAANLDWLDKRETTQSEFNDLIKQKLGSDWDFEKYQNFVKGTALADPGVWGGQENMAQIYLDRVKSGVDKKFDTYADAAQAAAYGPDKDAAWYYKRFGGWNNLEDRNAAKALGISNPNEYALYLEQQAKAPPAQGIEQLAQAQEELLPPVQQPAGGIAQLAEAQPEIVAQETQTQNTQEEPAGIDQLLQAQAPAELSKPVLNDVLTALKVSLGKLPFDAKYDVNGDGQVTTTDVLGLQKAVLNKDPGFDFVSSVFSAPAHVAPVEVAPQIQETQTQPQEPPSQGGSAQLAQTQAPAVPADTGISSLAPVAGAAVIDAINTAADTQQAQTQEPPAQGGIEQLAETKPETIVPPTQQLAQETTGGLDQLINAINNPETTSSYTGTNVADVSGGITGLPSDQPTDQDLAQLGVGLPTGLTDTTDQGGVDVGDGGISSLLDQGQTGNGYQQGKGAFTGIDTGTVASDQTTGGTGMEDYFDGGDGAFLGSYEDAGDGIAGPGGEGSFPGINDGTVGSDQTNELDAGQGEGAFPGTEPGTVASDQPGGDTGLTPGMWQQLSTATGLPVNTLKLLGAGLGAVGLGSLFNRQQTAPAPTPYTGPLSNITFNPATYTPYTYKPYAGGGAVESMSNANAIGANTGFPMADIQRGAYSTPYQQPISQNVVTGAQDTRVDPYTGAEMFASGGIANLGGYSDGGRLLRGPGDGVSDSIPAMIGNRQPARLADGEFVIPARIVSEIGNGSTDAGARKLYEMMDRVQAARRKTTGKGKFAANTKADKYLPT